MEKNVSSRKSFGKASDLEEQKDKEQIEAMEAGIEMPGADWGPSIHDRAKRLRPKARAVYEELVRDFNEDFNAKIIELKKNRRENFKEAKKTVLFRTPAPGLRVDGGKKLRKRGQDLKEQAVKQLLRNEKNELLMVKNHYKNNIERIFKQEGLSAENAKERESGDSIKGVYNLGNEKPSYLQEKFENRAKENKGRELEV